MRAIAILLLLSSVAYADIPEAARDAAAEASRLARAGDWAGALDSANRVIVTAPGWSEGYFLRAGIEVHALGPETTADALASAEPSADDAALAAQLEAPAKDLRRYLELAWGAPDRDRAQAAAEDLEARAARASELAQAYAQKLADDAARAKREEEEAARLARQRAHNAHWRHAGTAMALLGLAAGVGSVVLAVDGMGRYDSVGMGGFASGADIDGQIATGRGEVIGSYVSVGAAVVLVIAGVTTITSHEDPE